MYSARAFYPAVLAVVLFLGACDRKAVEIVEPDPGAAPFNPDDRGNSTYQNYPDGVHRFVVRFDRDFKPETFRASLDGVDITRTFEPSPVAGGMSRARAPENFTDGVPIVRGTVIITTPQWPSPTRVDATDRRTHKLVVQGEISSLTGMFFWDHDVVNFRPPQPSFSPKNLTLQRNSVASPVQVLLEQPPTAGPVNVSIMPTAVQLPTATVPASITPNNTVVSLNGQTAGQPITITFSPGEREKTFSILGVSRGSFVLFATARGFQVAGVSGFVQ